MSIGFFTSVTYGNRETSIVESLSEAADDYFFLFGHKAYVVQNMGDQESVVFSDGDVSPLLALVKVISYFTIVIPLIMLAAKAALRSTHTFSVIDPKRSLERHVNITPSTIEKIQRVMQSVIARTSNEEVDVFGCNNFIFKLKGEGAPNLVFKLAHGENPQENTEERFANMVKAKEICLAHQLGLLIVPHAKKFEVEVQGISYTLIAEECLDIDRDESAQEENYRKYAPRMNETARQLATFIARTGFNDVTWRNIPLINDPEGSRRPKRVALVDLEHMQSARQGFEGSANRSRGLIRCVGEEQIDIVLGEAKARGIDLVYPEALKQERLEELRFDRELREFHQQKGIVTGREPLDVNLDLLDLDLDAVEEIRELSWAGGKLHYEPKPVTMRQVAQEVVDKINRQIQKGSESSSLKGKRSIIIGIHEEPFREYDRLGVSRAVFLITPEEEKMLWLRRIIDALVEAGHLFKLEKVTGHGYEVQA